MLFPTFFVVYLATSVVEYGAVPVEDTHVGEPAAGVPEVEPDQGAILQGVRSILTNLSYSTPGLVI